MTDSSEPRPPRPRWGEELAAASRRLLYNLSRNVGRLVIEAGRDGTRVAVELNALGSSTSKAMIDLRAATRSAPRVAAISAEVARIAASYKLHQTKHELLQDQPTSDAVLRLHEVNAERLYALCVEMRGAVLKVGQLLSSRADLLPHAYIERLSKLQDQVPPVPTEAITAIVEAELGEPIGDLFAEFEAEPLAAASLAQVHGAKLHDGRSVVVKVLQPGIEDLVEADLTAFQLIARVLTDRLPHLDLVTVATELGRSVRRELDYAAEAENARRVAAAFAGDETVVVPGVIAEYSSRRVLTMQRLDGQRLTDFLDAKEASDAAANEALLEALVAATARQILKHGLFQADPHPGNFLVLTDSAPPRLGLLDFGNVGRLTSEARSGYAKLAMALASGNTAAFAEGLSSMGFKSPLGADALTAFAESFIAAFRAEAGRNLADLDPRELLERGLALARQHPIHVPEDFVAIGRVFATLSGLLLRYGKNLNLPALVLPHLV